MLAIAVAASVGRRRRGWPYGRCLRRTAAAPAGGWARPALHTRNLAYRRGPPGRSQPRQAIERAPEAHLHFHGVIAEDVAAILEDSPGVNRDGQRRVTWAWPRQDG
jgi:hypothetical protein